jgi:predicted ATPase
LPLSQPQSAPPAPLLPPTNLPASSSPLIGRSTETAEVTELLGTQRLVSLIGPGGIGKTRLALEVARGLRPRFPAGAWLVELAPLSDPFLVPMTVAVAMGLKVPAAESPARVAAALGGKRVLVVLDNCEHVIEAAARMAEALLRANPHAHVMATSREPLRTPGEHAYRVPSLLVPKAEAEAPEQVLASPAVQLFVTRAQAVDMRFSLESRSVAVTAAICRRLDGIPLAIELAAARTATLGVEELAARLGDRFRVLTGGHRTALPRHQTLRATIDWSYGLLGPVERTVLHRIAVFAGSFGLEAAGAVAADDDLDALTAVDAVTSLAAKSLLVVEPGAARYRLRESMRAYALEKLAGAGDLERVARRHAQYQREVFERAEGEWETRSTADWLGAYGPELDNLRAALDWAFSPAGDASIGVDLTAASIPLWLQQSLLVECRGRVERALAGLEADSGRPARRRMQLQAALGVSLMHTKGAAADTFAAWAGVLETAGRLADADYELRALWALWQFHTIRGECRSALTLAERFYARAGDGGADGPIGERLVGASLHYLGDQAGARSRLERALARYPDPLRRSHAIRFQYDQKVAARLVLARVLWLQGFPTQAGRMAEETVEAARAVDHPLSLCVALEVACMVALWCGDANAAERWVTSLLDHSGRHALRVRHRGARCFDGALLMARGDVEGGVDLLHAGLGELRESGFVPYYPFTVGMLAQGLGRAGQVAQALVTIDEVLATSERTEERWYTAELLRIKGELVAQAGGPAEAILEEALDLARRQEVRSLELRAAMARARHWHGLGRREPARALLAPVYGAFTEGLETADLRAAAALLDELA